MNQPRNRAWRLFQRIKYIKKRKFRRSHRSHQRLIRGKLSKTKGVPRYGINSCWRPSKNWKLIYLRKHKLARASQLKMEYPRKPLWLLDEDLFLTED